jgi:murein DD-endopeptidase MepM/ murein hydrolase activator NlpD
VPWTEEDDAKFAAMSKPPERSKWRRFMDSAEQMITSDSFPALVARTIAPILDSGDPAEQRKIRAANSRRERAKREKFANTDPADTLGEHVVDFLGGIAGSAVDPTTYVGAVGKNLGERIVNAAGVNAGIDVGMQAAEMGEGVRDAYDPVRGAINVAAPGVILGGAKGAQVASKRLRPVVGRVTSAFGKRKAPKAGASTNHGGIDIAVPEGTVVQAPGGGVVSKVGRGDSKRGNWVEIDHGDGLTSRYFHLAGFRVKPGDRLEPGQLFGRSGKSGNVTGPHLHWSVLKDGKPVDPDSVDFNLSTDVPRAAHPMSPEGIRGAVRDEEAGVLTPEAQRIIDEADDSNVVPLFKDPYDEFFAGGDEASRQFRSDVEAAGLKGVEDVLTPAERQEMDASVTGRPPAENTGYEKYTPNMEPKAAANDPVKPSVGETIKGTIKAIIDDESGSYRQPVEDDMLPPKSEAEEKIMRALREAKPLTNEQRSLYHEERSQRASSLANLQKEGGSLDNYRKQLGAASGDLPRVDYESIAKDFTPDDYSQLFNKINGSNSLLPYEKLTAQSALVKLLSEEGSRLPTPSEIRLLSEVFHPDFIESLLKNQPLIEQLKKTAISALNVPRALMASADISAPFRQGIFLIGRKEFWKSLGPMFKVLFSEKNSRALLDEIKGRDSWKLMKEAGLAITDPHNHFLLDKEEDFMTDLAEKIPLWGRVVKGSNRAYSGFLNRLRADYFDHMITKYEEAGINLAHDKKRTKGLAKFINSATGRGDLGKLNAAAPLLNNLFFSPRLIKARIDMLNPITYVQSDPIVRKEAWKNLMALGGVATGVAGLASMAGMDVETDPRSSDFMKPKIGNTRYDILGGFQQYIRLGAQLATNSKITSKGDEQELGGEGPFDDSKATLIKKFFRSKQNPIVSFGWNYAHGENVIGEKFDRTQDAMPGSGKFMVPSEVMERFIPMASQDIIDAYNEHGNKGVLMAAPALTGVGVQTYDPNAKKEEEDLNKEFEDFKKGFSSSESFEDFKKGFE